MKRLVRNLLIGTIGILFFSTEANAQAIKTNIPLILTGNPNVGVEWTVSKQFAINGEITWLPYLFKETEEVFRSLEGSVDLRYYFNPKYYYTNDLFDGFYVGPYAMYGNFNIGLEDGNLFGLGDGYRRKGWGLSTGASIGYKFYVSSRFRLDINLGLGYAHLQYNKYQLGGEFANYPLSIKDTKAYWGPTKFGIHLVYNIFR